MKSIWKLVAIPLFFYTALMSSQSGYYFTSDNTPSHFPISGGTMAGLRVKFVQPVFPDEARKKHINGTVVLHVLISKIGAVESVEAISGPEILRVPYIEAVRQWKYKPYLLNGEPAAVDTTVTITMQMSGEPPNQP